MKNERRHEGDEEHGVSRWGAGSTLAAGFSKRLRQVIGDRSVLQFSRECGISDSLMRKYLCGSLPGLGKLVRLAEVGGVGVDWLATGGQENGPRRTEAGVEVGDDSATEGPEASNLPLIFNRDWLRRESHGGASLVHITAIGDAMQPTISAGDPLLLDRTCNQVSQDAIYVIHWMEELVPKRLQIDWEGGVWVRSDNPLYQDQRLQGKAESRLNIIGRVVWIGKRI